MKYVYILLLCFCTSNLIVAQTEVNDTTSLEEIVISANKVPEKKSVIAQQISIIKKEYITAQSPLNSADLLQSTGAVFVQKSQQGGGSPVLRGFEASRILLVIDGVRMNNLIYRAGHLQNVITLDHNVLDRIEILNGPGSTVYGSDALGGVLHFRTKSPSFSQDEKTLISGSVSSSFHSVNQGINMNGILQVGGRKWASISSVTLTRFGDLKMGGSKNPFNDLGYFGERLKYADRIDGKDVLVDNKNKLVQKFSGYDQIDILQKVLFKQNNKLSHGLNIQYSNSTNIPRYDRLTDVKGTGLNSAEWYYGPQKRLFIMYNLHQTMDGFFEAFDVTGSYQKIQESRHNRNFGSSKLNHRVEDVEVAGLQFSALHKSEKNEIRSGADIYWNGLTSTAFQENINTGETSPLDTRYPDGNNNQINAALYATHTLRINKHFTLNDGIRLGFNSLKSTFNNKSFFPFPFDEIKQNNAIYSGNLGLIFSSNGLRLAYLSIIGFRTPNVDDLAKVFESVPGRVIVPNPDLKPETTINNELNLGYANKTWSIENVIYYTSLTNFISLAPGTFDGQPAIIYNDSLSQVFSSVNRAKGYIYGFNSSIRKQFGRNWSVYGNAIYTYGRSKNEGKVSPLDHIPPLITKVGVEANYTKWDAAFYIIGNGKKRIADYSPSGEDNAQYAPPSGMPAWVTYNIRGGFHVVKMMRIQIGVENILDTQFRYFASGINAPGRNFWASIRFNF